MSSSEDWATPKSSMGRNSWHSANEHIPPTWDKKGDVLSTATFPSTSILRKKESFRTGTCQCGPEENHRSLAYFNACVAKESIFGDGTLLQGIKVCWCADNIWECKLPRDLTGLDKRVTFENLGTIYQAQKVLWNGTYWFRRLMSTGKTASQKHSRNGVAVLRLLAGMSRFSGKERVDQLVKMQIHKGSVQKLRNILAVVDGLLMQVALTFPEDPEIQSWRFIDRMVHSLISCLLPDYFREERSEFDRVTTFEKVKEIRKEIKKAGFNPAKTVNDSVEIPRELGFFRTILNRLSDTKSPYSHYQTMVLSQTRASGVPPKAVYFKTLKKIVDILQTPCSMDQYNCIKGFLKPAVDEIYFDAIQSVGGVENQDRFFTDCMRAAKISLSDSGEFFSKANDGGKLEAARLVLKDMESIDEINLTSGELTGKSLARDTHSSGEMLFCWACHQFLDRTNVYDRNVMSVRIGLVAELGKYRAITVSHLAHAVLLHVMSHVLLEFLRVIPSSESGVGAANHAWNFFKRLSHKNPSANFLFSQDRDVYLFSTDWSQATDYCDHKIAMALLNPLCKRFGIPDWYRETCMFALFAPRQVETVDPEEKILQVFYTKRGVLMGDPVTKVVLHLYHLVVRFSIKRFIHEQS